MANIPEHDLLNQIERFLERTGMVPTAFGRSAINDANLITQLRDGRELRRDTRARVSQYIMSQSQGGVSDAPLSEAS
jgi:hypothetical protein